MKNFFLDLLQMHQIVFISVCEMKFHHFLYVQNYSVFIFKVYTQDHWQQPHWVLTIGVAP